MKPTIWEHDTWLYLVIAFGIGTIIGCCGCWILSGIFNAGLFTVIGTMGTPVP